MIILNHSLTHFSMLIALKPFKSLAYIMDTGICGNSPLNCCPNYYKENNSCVECLPGSYQSNCSKKCPINHYGRLCLDMCNCASDETCDAEKGCIYYEINKKSISSHFVLSFGVLLAVLTVVGISYTIAKKKHHFRQNIPDSNDSSFRNTHEQKKMEMQDRAKEKFDTGTPYSSSGESSLNTGGKSLVIGNSGMEIAKDKTFTPSTMQMPDYCMDSYHARRFSPERLYSLYKKSPVSRSYSETSLLYLSPSNLFSTSLTDVRNSIENLTSDPYSDRDTYVEIQINLANSEKSFHNQAENIQDRFSQQNLENMKESKSKYNGYDLAVPTGDKIKVTAVKNDKQLFLKDLSNQIFKMKRKE